MRCNWSTTTNTLFRRSSRAEKLPCRALHSRPAIDCKLLLARSQSHVLTSRSHSWFDGTNNGATFTPSPQFLSASSSMPHTVAKISSSSNLTEAQMSRAACQAVRLSIQNGALGDAYYIVNSLQHSTLYGTASNPKQLRSLQALEKNTQSVAIDSGRGVSPRLSSHALLHGLIRIGLVKKAYRLAKLMMESGIRLRSRTLEAVIHGLTPRPTIPTAPDDRLVKAFKKRLERPSVLNLRPSMVEDESTRFALELLVEARSSRQRRTDGMYKTLIGACLFNGEIIVASLLFGLVVKDWELRRSLAIRLNTAAPSEADEQRQSDKSMRARYNHLRTESVFPSRFSMYSVLSSIEETLSQDGEGDAFRWTLRAALQALGSLAMLLDARKIPFAEIAPLICTIYKCPRVEDEIWIFDEKGRPKQVQAYAYFHSVLKRLIGSLPVRRPPRIIMDPKIASTLPPLDPQRYKHMLPPLDLSGYNALLHYALRHRLSPGLAHKILHHMLNERYKPLQPDIVTYNILIRSGTLLRNSSIAEQALQALRLKEENVDHGIVVSEEGDKPNQASSMSHIFPPSRFSKSLSRLDRETLSLPTILNAKRQPDTRPITADHYTLSSYVTHLTSTGQPHVVANLLFRVLPELTIVDHPSWGTLTREERKRMQVKSKEACLKRAVTYGPYFFTTVLNALCKAGKTGLTERVWLLAKRAERASWNPSFVPEIQPWCLPVHAYTTMLQCYAMEAGKGPVVRKPSHAHTSDPDPWVPRSKRFVVGWANYILGRNAMIKYSRHRRSMARRTGILLYRSMRSGGRAVYQAFSEMQKTNVQRKPVQAPRPDTRFFNAALDLFARRPRKRPRSAQCGRAHWKRYLTFTKIRYAQSGVVSKYWNPLMQEIAEDMAEAGYAMPSGYRHLFVGRWIHGTLQHDSPRQLERRPFAFPRLQQPFSPYSLPTHKSRGLPLGHRRQRHLRTWKCN